MAPPTSLIVIERIAIRDRSRRALRRTLLRGSNVHQRSPRYTSVHAKSSVRASGQRRCRVGSRRHSAPQVHARQNEIRDARSRQTPRRLRQRPMRSRLVLEPYAKFSVVYVVHDACARSTRIGCPEERPGPIAQLIRKTVLARQGTRGWRPEVPRPGAVRCRLERTAPVVSTNARAEAHTPVGRIERRHNFRGPVS